VPAEVRRDLPDVVVGRQQGAGQRRVEHRRALDADPGGGDDPGSPTPELAVAGRVVGKDNRRIAVRMSGDPAGRHDEGIVATPASGEGAAAGRLGADLSGLRRHVSASASRCAAIVHSSSEKIWRALAGGAPRPARQNGRPARPNGRHVHGLKRDPRPPLGPHPLVVSALSLCIRVPIPGISTGQIGPGRSSSEAVLT
jgi:hypothetical protein